MKNNSKEVGKKIYQIYYNDTTKSFEIEDFDTVFVNNYGVYYIDYNNIKLVPFNHIAEYKDFSKSTEDFVKTRLLNYLLEACHCDAAFIIAFIHKENAEEFIETHQDLLKVKDLGIHYDMIGDQFKYSGFQQLTNLNVAIRSIVESKGNYKTDSIKDFLYTYISDVVDICNALETEKVEN